MSIWDILDKPEELKKIKIKHYSQEELSEYYLNLTAQVLGRTEDVLLDRPFTIEEAFRLIMELFYEHHDVNWSDMCMAVVLHTEGYEDTYFFRLHDHYATKYNPFTQEFE